MLPYKYQDLHQLVHCLIEHSIATFIMYAGAIEVQYTTNTV